MYDGTCIDGDLFYRYPWITMICTMPATSATMTKLKNFLMEVLIPISCQFAISGVINNLTLCVILSVEWTGAAGLRTSM